MRALSAPAAAALCLCAVALAEPAGRSTAAAADSAAAPAARPGPGGNPVLPGDFPDPSVIRVGDEYWAAATSSEWAPPFPLLRSPDLRRWRLVGSVLPAPPPWAEGSFWAPELSADRGRYYVYYTARRRGGPLCVAAASADRPGGPYRDHGPLLCQEAGSIDAAAIRDEAGALHLIWKEDGNSADRPTPIWAQRLSEDRRQLLGERRELLRNDAPWEGTLVEGPFPLWRGGWIYLFYSANTCCGDGCRYALGVARARRLLGPYEKSPRNPILAGGGRWRCPGHGSLVSGPGERTFLLYHGYGRGSIFVGRQGLLDEVRWGADGWPSIARGAPGAGEAPGGAAGGAEDAGGPAAHLGGPVFEDFRRGPPGPRWQWPADAPSPLQAGADPAAGVVLTPAVAGPAAGYTTAPEVVGAVLGHMTSGPDYEATAALVSATGSGGLAAYGDRNNAVGVAIAGRRAVLWRREGGAGRVLAAVPWPGGAATLRLRVRGGRRLAFAISKDGRAFRGLGPEVDAARLPPWDRGLRVALTAGGGPATFAWFRLAPLAP